MTSDVEEAAEHERWIRQQVKVSQHDPSMGERAMGWAVGEIDRLRVDLTLTIHDFLAYLDERGIRLTPVNPRLDEPYASAVVNGYLVDRAALARPSAGPDTELAAIATDLDDLYTEACSVAMRSEGSLIAAAEELRDDVASIRDRMRAALASTRADDNERVELAAAWLHSWAGAQMRHPWKQVGPARKATMRARARGVLNILRHGDPSDSGHES